MEQPRIVLIHYHLRPSGVTRILEAQSRILTSLGISHVILHGGQNSSQLESTATRRIDALDYSTETNEKLYQTCLETATSALGAPPNLWHIHNPTLGKNAAFPELLRQIADSLTPLLLQTHDFAEDGRPQNLTNLQLETYPVAPQIHYATLNSRDAQHLKAASITSVSVLPPPIEIQPTQRKPIERTTQSPPLLLYPVRGIRRKNLGEAVLMTALTGHSIAVTLAPRNPEWIPQYEKWIALSKQLDLPIEFAVVDRITPDELANTNLTGENVNQNNQLTSDYSTWLAHSTHILSTSVAEGFGLAFLEPIGHQIPMLGRNLAEITQDFPDIHENNLYQALLIPKSWLDQEQLKTTLLTQWQRTLTLYQQPLDKQSPHTLWEHIHSHPDHPDHYDFAQLPENFQEIVIRHITEHPQDRDHILALSNKNNQPPVPFAEWIASALCLPSPKVEQIKAWSPQEHANQLIEIYHSLLGTQASPPEWRSYRDLLPHKLAPEHFRVLHSSPQKPT